MRLTIIKDDNSVTVDGERHTVDCSELPATFHALQWEGNHGEVEYKTLRCDHCGVRSRKGNDIISDVSPYAKYVDAWHIAKAAADAARLAKQAEIDKAMEAMAEAQANAARQQG